MVNKSVGVAAARIAGMPRSTSAGVSGNGMSQASPRLGKGGQIRQGQRTASFRHRQVEPPAIGDGSPQGGAVSAEVVVGDDRSAQLAGQHVSKGGRQLPSLVRNDARHQPAAILGMPSTRSEMMLRWISEVPAQMVVEREYR